MWSRSMSVGCVLSVAAWVAAFALIAAGWATDTVYVAHLGLATAGVAVALTIIRDNQRTRRQIYATHKRGGGGGGNLLNFVRLEDRF